MAWTVRIAPFAQKQLAKLDKPVARRILDWIEDRLEECKDPRHWGEALKGDLAGLWRYRIDDFRIICELKDWELVVLLLTVGRRREIYRR